MDVKAILMGLAFALMWSSAFTSARIIVQDAPPLAALACRFLLSGLVGILIARLLGQTWQLTRKQWISVGVFGVCQNALYLGLNFYAMQTIDASLASIIASTMPLMVAGAGWLFLKDRLPPIGVAGFVLGIAGVVVIMGARLSGAVDPVGVALCLLGAAALTVATLVMRSAASGGNLLMVIGLQMLVGAAVLGGISAAIETIEVRYSPELIAAFLYTTFVPGLLATFVWFSLVERIGAVRASTFHFLNPFFGVAIAMLLLGERLGAMDLVGVIVITVGILMVQLSKQNPTES
jgi:drug/metabolite transporter (DMT)-like permease